MNKTWTIGEALTWTTGYFTRHNIESARVCAQQLLSFVTGMSRVALYTQPEKPLTPDELHALHEGIERRAAGEPLQYIIGTVGFRFLDIKVAPGVLIPRPETEVAVSEALSHVPKDEPFTALDLCTGSGCIALSLAYERPEAHVLASDISEEAVALCCENRAALNLEERVEVFCGDLGAAIPEEYVGHLDLIVSNPPYIPDEVMKELPDEVSLHEPHLALAGGADGLDVFRRIVDFAQTALREDGWLVCELHETTLDAAQAYAQKRGFHFARQVSDLAGKPRVLALQRGV